MLRNNMATGRSPVAGQKQLPKTEHKQVPQRRKKSLIMQNQENIGASGDGQGRGECACYGNTERCLKYTAKLKSHMGHAIH